MELDEKEIMYALQSIQNLMEHFRKYQRMLSKDEKETEQAIFKMEPILSNLDFDDLSLSERVTALLMIKDAIEENLYGD